MYISELFGKKIKTNENFMNQNQESLFKANYHMVIRWLIWMNRN